MRIRKTASKVLGSSSSFRSPPPFEDYHHCAPPPEELLLCQLNCSPWDVLDLESNLHHFTFQEEGGRGGDEGRGIMGNVFKFEDYEEILANAKEAAAAFTSTAADELELNSKEDDNGDDKKAKKKKRRRRKKKEEVINVKDMDKIATKNSSITYCKKNDGKGWQCKRPANQQHSLCDHHLDLLRNYSSRTNNRENYESDTDHHPPVKSQRPKSATATAETAGDGFYYYSGFGPWRGKKRSSGTDHARPKEAATDDEDNDEEDDDDDEKGEARKDESDAPVAGDDLDDDTNEEEDDVELNKGRYKKKGRKRVKARSLKSLM